MLTELPVLERPALHDGFGRTINYLRISLTDRCNLRCVYCMPTHLKDFIPGPEILTRDEIVQVAGAAVELGFRKIRFTGGEPLLRRDVVEIVAGVAGLPGLEDLAMTTNGTRLPKLARPLKEAGLRRVNIHVDTLNPERLPKIMRWGTLEEIWAGIRAAEEAGFAPLKLNAVVTRGYNDQDVVDLARLTIDHDWAFRFIELMPLGTNEPAQISIKRFVSNKETKRRIEEALGTLALLPNDDPGDESVNYRLPGAQGTVGFISPVSDPYCGTCTRMRLTADGRFHLCLLNDDEIDVKPALRNSGFEELKALLTRAVEEKPVGHKLWKGLYTRKRQMHALGG